MRVYVTAIPRIQSLNYEEQRTTPTCKQAIQDYGGIFAVYGPTEGRLRIF